MQIIIIHSSWTQPGAFNVFTLLKFFLLNRFLLALLHLLLLCSWFPNHHGLDGAQFLIFDILISINFKYALTRHFPYLMQVHTLLLLLIIRGHIVVLRKLILIIDLLSTLRVVLWSDSILHKSLWRDIRLLLLHLVRMIRICICVNFRRHFSCCTYLRILLCYRLAGIWPGFMKHF
jgi:hypothetical protein